MSGFMETRAAARRRRMMVIASAAIGAAGAALIIRYGGVESRSAPPVVTAGPACIALAIDRDTGVTTQEPCSTSRVLVAEQGASR